MANRQKVLEKWMANHVGPQAYLHALKERVPLWFEKMPELPELLYDSLKQGRNLNQRLDNLYQGYRQSKRQQGTAKFCLVLEPH